jgi:hypothetical protein
VRFRQDLVTNAHCRNFSPRIDLQVLGRPVLPLADFRDVYVKWKSGFLQGDVAGKRTGSRARKQRYF